MKGAAGCSAAPAAMVDEGSPAVDQSLFENSITRDSCSRHQRFSTVMAGLVPAIHAERLGRAYVGERQRRGVDARDKPGHDGVIAVVPF